MSIFANLTNMDCNTTTTCLRKDASSVLSHIGNYQNQISNKFNSIFNSYNLSYLPNLKTEIIRTLYIICPPMLSFGIGILFTYYLMKNKENQKNQKSIDYKAEEKEENSNEIENLNITINDTLQPNSYIESYINKNEYVAKTIAMNKIQIKELHREKEKLEKEIESYKCEIRSLNINKDSLEEEIEVLHSTNNSTNNKLHQEISENITENTTENINENRVNSNFTSRFNIGDKIRLFNLEQLSQFNNKTGVIESFNSLTNYYIIKIDNNVEGVLNVSSSKIKPTYMSALFEEEEYDGTEEQFLYYESDSHSNSNSDSISDSNSDSNSANNIETKEDNDTIATGDTLPENNQEENKLKIENKESIEKVKDKLTQILKELDINNNSKTIKDKCKHNDILILFKPIKKYSSSKIKIINRIKELITEDDVSDQNKLNIIKHFELLDYYPSN